MLTPVAIVDDIDDVALVMSRCSDDGDDVTPNPSSSFFEEHGGAVINATLSLYSHASLQIRKDKKVFIKFIPSQPLAPVIRIFFIKFEFI